MLHTITHCKVEAIKLWHSFRVHERSSWSAHILVYKYEYVYTAPRHPAAMNLIGGVTIIIIVLTGTLLMYCSPIVHTKFQHNTG